MKNLLILAILIFTGQLAMGQKYFTKEGNISFFSEAPIENIEAHNYKATAVLDLESGNMEWAVLIKAFDFEKALMKEHFNENYMESSKYPKAKFAGSISDVSALDISKDGTYSVQVNGLLTIHGTQQEVSAEAKFEVEDGQVLARSTLKVLVADYNIEIPSVVSDNIAKEVEIKIQANFKKLSK